MSESNDLLRDAEVLRKLLTECLRRVDRLERQLRTEAVAEAEVEPPPAAPLTDPFEQALPDDEQTDRDGGQPQPIDVPPRNQMPPRRPPSPHRQPPPHQQHATRGQATQTPHVAPSRHQKPEPPAEPHAGPATSHSASGALDAFGDADAWNADPPVGDGTLDPFELLDFSAPPTESHNTNVSRAMNDLLGGLDIAPPNDDA